MTRLQRTAVVIGLALALGLTSAMLPSPAAAADNVLQVVAVRVNPGQLDTYLGKLQQLNAMLQRLEIDATMRVWQATQAGENTGTVVVGLDFANIAAFADASPKIQGDAEWQKLLASLDDLRSIVANSLYQEVTP